MFSFFLLIYLVALLIVFIVASFIIYHILRYSLDQSFGLVGIGVFLLILIFLVILNALSFFAIDFSNTSLSIPTSPKTSKTTPYAPSRTNPW